MMLETLLSSQSRAKLLGLFFLNPHNRYYLRQIESLTKLSLRTVQREVARLESCGLLVKEIEGNRTYYKANRESSIFPEVKGIVMKTEGLGALLQEAVEGLDIDVAFVYGSFAGNRETPESDIDLMVVGDVTNRKLHAALSKSEAFSRREVNTAVISPSEFRDRLARKDHFLNEVLKGPKIFIVGNENELDGFAEGRQATSSEDVEERDH
jgi:predicted nucleotidyltransferase